MRESQEASQNKLSHLQAHIKKTEKKFNKVGRKRSKSHNHRVCENLPGSCCLETRPAKDEQINVHSSNAATGDDLNFIMKLKNVFCDESTQ